MKLRITAFSGILAAVLASQAPAQGLVGPYLATRVAAGTYDFSEAADYATKALQADRDNPQLLADAVVGYVALGRFDQAFPYAERLLDTGSGHQVAEMVLIAELARKGSYQDILDRQAKGELKVAPVVDGLVKGWAEIGAGRMSEGLKTFDAVAEQPVTRAFGLYHKALALALAGDYEAADAILSSRTQEKLNLTRRGTFARIEILSQLEKDDEADEVLQQTFGPDLDPALSRLDAELKAGQTLPMTVIKTPNDGMAEVFYTVATALNNDTPKDFTLAFARTAEDLQPDHLDAILMSAALLEQLGRHELALNAYDSIPADSIYFYIAELGRADALTAEGQNEAAIEVLRKLAESHSTVPAIYVTLGDALRKLERYAEATEAYDRAIALYHAPQESQWPVYFARGITEEREKKWDRAESDFRLALKLRPDQPQVLNYLGYSYVEMNQNLDEALAMIQKAVTERPDDGYITDSLGWAYYRLGRYQDAVSEMERAVELMPVDPVINDHLGDVYWAVGRKREAEFQWRRALSFDPEEKDAARIRRKLEVGLDVVLKEEGSKPLAVAKDG